MNYINLGRSGLKVSRVCLGTMNFGPETDERTSYMIMDRALESGVTFFDTADVYGWKKGEGVTEQIVGRWLSQGGGRREKIVLATKVFGEMGDGPNDRGLSAYHLRRACEWSLRRLQTDHIDLFQMHHIDRDVPIEETMNAMEQLIREGKITYVGSSNFPAWHLAEWQVLARQRQSLALVSEQCIYSLADRTVELEVLPAARHFGLGVIPWSPLGGGMLAGILGKADGGRRAGEWAQAKLARHADAVAAYEDLCRDLDQHPVNVALAWVLANPNVTSPIVGPRTIEQLAACLAACELSLDDSTMARLDEIWPGPGGEAPEAYAW